MNVSLVFKEQLFKEQHQTHIHGMDGSGARGG